MNIVLKGYQKCNLFVGGDGRDKSIQKFMETSSAKTFYIKKNGDCFDMFEAEEVIPVVETKEPVKKPKKKKKEKKKYKTEE